MQILLGGSKRKPENTHTLKKNIKSTMAQPTANDFRVLACEMLNINPNRVAREVEKAITAFFGTGVDIMEDIWNRIDPIANVHKDSKPKHLLWAMLFLYHYHTEQVNCRIVGYCCSCIGSISSSCSSRSHYSN